MFSRLVDSHALDLRTRGSEFPKQLKVSEKASAWLASEVEAWMNERVAGRVLKSGDWNESPSMG